jgi:hypothetical protein
MLADSPQDIAMRATVMGALFGGGLSYPYECVSSNCTWPETYMTLGFQSTCNNVTAQVSRRCFDSDSGSGENCTMVTPKHASLNTYYSPGKQRTTTSVSTPAPADGCISATPFSCQDPGGPGSLITFAVYRWLGKSWSDDESNSWEVMECTLSAVAYEYSDVSVRENHFNIGKTKTTPLELSLFGGEGHKMYLNATDDSASFDINPWDWQTWRHFLESKIFTGEISGGVNWATKESGLAPSALQHANVSEIADKLAWALTNLVRKLPGHGNAAGIAQQKKTFVIIQWGWMALPVVTVFVAGVFLVLSILRASRCDELLWKSSTVALLSHQVAGWDELDVDAVHDQDQLEVMAKRVMLRLSRDQHMKFIKIGP